MTQTVERVMLKRACQVLTFMLTIIFLAGGAPLEAQTLAVPPGMPTLYKEIPSYVLARSRARHQIHLQGTIEYKGDGYHLIRGGQDFVILNQNPVCLRGVAGKMVEVQGKTTERVAPWFRLYFLMVDTIDGKKYDGKVGPWMRRAPTEKEICYWKLHKQLPPATRKFRAYLDLPKTASVCPASGKGSPQGG
jgi:hypothetical protein